MSKLIASALRSQFDLWVYEGKVVRRLADGDADLDLLLPDRWRSARPETNRSHREAEKEARRIKAKVRSVRRCKLASRRSLCRAHTFILDKTQ